MKPFDGCEVKSLASDEDYEFDPDFDHWKKNNNFLGSIFTHCLADEC